MELIVWASATSQQGRYIDVYVTQIHTLETFKINKLLVLPQLVDGYIYNSV